MSCIPLSVLLFTIAVLIVALAVATAVFLTARRWIEELMSDPLNVIFRVPASIAARKVPKMPIITVRESRVRRVHARKWRCRYRNRRTAPDFDDNTHPDDPSYRRHGGTIAHSRSLQASMIINPIANTTTNITATAAAAASGRRSVVPATSDKSVETIVGKNIHSSSKSEGLDKTPSRDMLKLFSTKAAETNYHHLSMGSSSIVSAPYHSQDFLLDNTQGRSSSSALFIAGGGASAQLSHTPSSLSYHRYNAESHSFSSNANNSNNRENGLLAVNNNGRSGTDGGGGGSHTHADSSEHDKNERKTDHHSGTAVDRKPSVGWHLLPGEPSHSHHTQIVDSSLNVPHDHRRAHTLEPLESLRRLERRLSLEDIRFAGAGASRVLLTQEVVGVVGSFGSADDKTGGGAEASYKTRRVASSDPFIQTNGGGGSRGDGGSAAAAASGSRSAGSAGGDGAEMEQSSRGTSLPIGLSPVPRRSGGDGGHESPPRRRRGVSLLGNMLIRKKGKLSHVVTRGHAWEIDFEEVALGAKIGEGGFAEVYKGEWCGLVVAVKIPKAASSMAQARFLEEVAIMSRQHHPNVVLFLGACITQPDLCIVMEYLPRGSLYDYIRQERQREVQERNVQEQAATNNIYNADDVLPLHLDGDVSGSDDMMHQQQQFLQQQSSSTADYVPPLTMGRVHKFAMDTARGMKYLHCRVGMVQRDLKTPNLLLDVDWNVKISDFGSSTCDMPRGAGAVLGGLAMSLAGGKAWVGGTPCWAAPEVVRGEKADSKADVFSFGVVLWELWTRKVPYEGMLPYKVAHGVAWDGLRLETKESNHIPPECVDLMRMCWHEDPKMRPDFSYILTRLQEIYKNNPKYWLTRKKPKRAAAAAAAEAGAEETATMTESLTSSSMPPQTMQPPHSLQQQLQHQPSTASTHAPYKDGDVHAGGGGGRGGHVGLDGDTHNDDDGGGAGAVHRGVGSGGGIHMHGEHNVEAFKMEQYVGP